MENRGWIVVVAMVLALVLTACGSGDANEDENDPGDDGVTDDVGPDDVAPSCGDGTCEMGEGCGSCADDCACTTEYTACREDACVAWDTINPLLKKIPGRWLLVEPPNTNLVVDVTVDPTDLDCYHCIVSVSFNPNPNPNEPGDACISGFQGAACLVLHGSSVRIVFPDTIDGSEGQVLSAGTRVEFTRVTVTERTPLAYERQ